MALWRRVRPRKAGIALLVIAVLGGVFYHPLKDDAWALLFLQHVKYPHALEPLRQPPARYVTEQRGTFLSPQGTTAARFYYPKDQRDAPGMVLIHGIHRMGIDEPRLVDFSRALAANGVAVMTPELTAIAQHRVDDDTIPVIGAASAEMRRRTGAKVGVMGLSFSGGLALMAAADPRWSDNVAFLVAVGAHHNLARVLRFYATNKIARPDGSTVEMQAHEYGALVVVYSNPQAFFHSKDFAIAAEALSAWLRESPEEARRIAARTSPETQRKLELLFSHQLSSIAPELLLLIESRKAEAAKASPDGHLARLRVPVLLLHGYGDTVIPPSETLWLANELPQEYVKNALVSRAVSHVSVEGTPTLLDQWRLVDFVSQMLHQAEITKD